MTTKQQTPASDLQRLASIYDSVAPNWNRTIGRGERLMLGKRWRADQVHLLHGNTLEVGMGAGSTISTMASQPHHVTRYTGIDLSLGMVAEAQKAAEGLSIPVTLLQANAEHMPMFADDSFDTVTASLVFCTVPDPEAALREIARVCKPNGRIVLIEHVLAPSRPVQWVQRMVSPGQVRKFGCHPDRPTDATLEQLGFRIEQQRSRWLGVFRFIIARPPGVVARARCY